jgi:crotonobetainyl-CoA:carnitine CoA-transferase CaiB-like acyl-CoA transferase
MTGTMATTGTPDSGPLKTGPAGADFLAGTHLLSAILLAITQRGMTGKGQVVEVAMADAVIPSLASSIAYLLGLGKEPLRTGNRHSGLAYAPYNVYPTQDGHVALFCVRDEHWRALCDVMEAPELKLDPRFATVPARTANLAETDKVVSAWIGARSRKDVFERLLKHRVPSAPVLAISEVVSDPHFLDRGTLVKIEHPVAGPIVVPSSPMRLSQSEPIAPRAARELGQDTADVLRELLKMSEDDIVRLNAAGVIGLPEGQA